MILADKLIIALESIINIETETDRKKHVQAIERLKRKRGVNICSM